MIDNIIKCINTLLSFIICLGLLARAYDIETSATGNWKGYAVFRDGVFGIQYHTAIMQTDTKNSTYPVIHADGTNPVKSDTWSNFMDGNTFQGICWPKNCTQNSTNQNAFVAKAKLLKEIPYIFSAQMYYGVTGTNATIQPSSILNIRCDGVVEYVYEYFGYRVGGADGVWNISKNNLNNYNAHSGTNITPYGQCWYYLTRVSSSLPQ